MGVPVWLVRVGAVQGVAGKGGGLFRHGETVVVCLCGAGRHRGVGLFLLVHRSGTDGSRFERMMMTTIVDVDDHDDCAVMMGTTATMMVLMRMMTVTVSGRRRSAGSAGSFYVWWTARRC